MAILAWVSIRRDGCVAKGRVVDGAARFADANSKNREPQSGLCSAEPLPLVPFTTSFKPSFPVHLVLNLWRKCTVTVCS
jgi:hypothetical protein